jgi:hypothetical protein
MDSHRSGHVKMCMRIVAHMFFVLAAFCCAGTPLASAPLRVVRTELPIGISEPSGRQVAFSVTRCASAHNYNSKVSYQLVLLTVQRIINAKEKKLFRQAIAISPLLKFRPLAVLRAKSNLNPFHLS